MHIQTPRQRLSAETGSLPGAVQQGPTQNGIAQGQCTFDVMAGILDGLVSNAPAIAGTATTIALGGGSAAGIAGGLASAGVNAVMSGQAAFNESVACQQLENGALANSLGLGAIQAP